MTEKKISSIPENSGLDNFLLQVISGKPMLEIKWWNICLAKLNLEKNVRNPVCNSSYPMLCSFREVFLQSKRSPPWSAHTWHFIFIVSLFQMPLKVLLRSKMITWKIQTRERDYASWLCWGLGAAQEKTNLLWLCSFSSPGEGESYFVAFEDNYTIILGSDHITLLDVSKLCCGGKKVSQKSQRLARVHTLSEISLKTFKINTQL